MEASDNAEAIQEGGSEGEGEECEALEIVAESNGQYEIKWDTIDERTGLPWVTLMFSYEAGFPYDLLQIWQSQQAHQGSTEASTSKLQTTHSVTPPTLHSSNIHSSPIPTGPRSDRVAVMFTSTRQNGNRQTPVRNSGEQDRGSNISSSFLSPAIPTGPRNPEAPRERGPRWAPVKDARVQIRTESNRSRSPERSSTVSRVEARGMRGGYGDTERVIGEGLQPALDIGRSSAIFDRPVRELNSSSSVRRFISATQEVDSQSNATYSPSRSTYIPSPSNRRQRSLSPYRESTAYRRRSRSRSRSRTPPRYRYRSRSRSRTPPRYNLDRERDRRSRRRSPSPIHYQDRSGPNYRNGPRSRSRSRSRSRRRSRSFSRSPPLRRRSRSPYTGRPYFQRPLPPSPSSYIHTVLPNFGKDVMRMGSISAQNSHGPGSSVDSNNTKEWTSRDTIGSTNNVSTSVHSRQPFTQIPPRPEVLHKLNSDTEGNEETIVKLDSDQAKEEEDVKPSLKTRVQNDSEGVSKIIEDNSISARPIIKTESSPFTSTTSLPLDSSISNISYSQEPEPPSQSIPPPSPPPPPLTLPRRSARSDITPPRLTSNDKTSPSNVGSLTSIISQAGKRLSRLIGSSTSEIIEERKDRE